jgi:hypothetical protein
MWGVCSPSTPGPRSLNTFARAGWLGQPSNIRTSGVVDRLHRHRCRLLRSEPSDPRVQDVHRRDTCLSARYPVHANRKALDGLRSLDSVSFVDRGGKASIVGHGEDLN